MSKNKITAVLGPTNTGKTYLAIETMLSFDSGMIGFPLRLLAREVYDKIIKKISKKVKISLKKGKIGWSELQNLIKAILKQHRADIHGMVHCTGGVGGPQEFLLHSFLVTGLYVAVLNSFFRRLCFFDWN